MLRELGHKVKIHMNWDGSRADLMLALHARRSHASIRAFAACYPDQPVILALTGTDLYRDIRTDPDARTSMQLATRMIVLQEMGLHELAPSLRRKTHVVYQSAPVVSHPPPRLPLRSCFEVVVSGHLREEKDPFRTAAALSFLPRESSIRITHIGSAMSSKMEQTARTWMKREPRYRWLGEVPHGKALRLLARSRLMVISSRMEGGANVVSEALANHVPVIASHISGNIGMLGKDYAGFYPLADERALARLLSRAETDRVYYQKLAGQCRARRPLISRTRERSALRRVLIDVI